METEIYDKDVVIIDMNNANMNNDVYCDFYVDILQPIRNAVYIKIMRTAVVLKPDNTSQFDTKIISLDGQAISDDDPIYIRMNNYERVSSVILETIKERQSAGSTQYIDVKKPTVYKYFDSIHMNLSSVYQLFNWFSANATTEAPSILYKNDYQQSAFDPNDTSVYTLYPMEPSLKRFSVELRNKNNQFIKQSDIISFKMTICVYSLKKKF